ncbi:MAG TPA: hypothetical protein VL424_06210 [Pararobbsia sp.]|jgi:plasmid stabilization system protein ParE|nr:hypothetical protein [Pararobbsia sp.]
MSTPVDYTSKALSDLANIRESIKRATKNPQLAKSTVKALHDAAQSPGDSGPPARHWLGEEVDGYYEGDRDSREVRKNIVLDGRSEERYEIVPA